MVFAPGTLGELGIAPAPRAAAHHLEAGEVRVQAEGQEEQSFYVGGGALEVQPHLVTVLADTAARAKDLDEAAALGREAARRRRRAQPQRQNGHRRGAGRNSRGPSAQLRAIAATAQETLGPLAANGVCHAAFRRHTRRGPGQADELRPAESAAALGRPAAAAARDPRRARARIPANIYVVYGHGGAQVQAALRTRTSSGCCRRSSSARATP